MNTESVWKLEKQQNGPLCDIEDMLKLFQLHYYHNVWKKACSMPDWTGFVSAFVKVLICFFILGQTKDLSLSLQRELYMGEYVKDFLTLPVGCQD